MLISKYIHFPVPRERKGSFDSFRNGNIFSYNCSVRPPRLSELLVAFLPNPERLRLSASRRWKYYLLSYLTFGYFMAALKT